MSQNPWPDWSSKEFVNDLPIEVLTALVQAGESYHFILCADDHSAIVCEVVLQLFTGRLTRFCCIRRLHPRREACAFPALSA